MTTTMEEYPVITIVLRRKGKWYAATVNEIPAVHTQGKTVEEALDNVKDAIHELAEADKMIARGDVKALETK